MKPVLRTGIAFAALAFPACLLAADPPSAGGIDLGAMKLKKAVTPGQPAPAGAAQPAPTTALPAVQRQSSTAPVARQPLNQQPAPQQQGTPQQAAPQQPSNVAANQTGVGTVVGTAPIGRRPASEILGQNVQTQQTSGDVQVKMPTMFKKVNPGQ